MSGSSGSVTVPGVSSTSLTLSFNGSANLGLANQIANALAQASGNSTLDVVDPYLGGAISAPPPGTITEELVMSPTVSGSITIPAAASGIGQVLVLANTQAITIHGSSNLSIVGGGPGAVTIDDPSIVDIGNGIGSTGTVSVTFTTADSPYQVAMGEGFETVNTQGSGTIWGGTGPDVINVGPSASNNVIEAGSDGTTVNTAGFAASIDGSSGNLTVVDAGYLDTITGGNNFSTAVTTSGFRASVLGGTGDQTVLSEVDLGLRNTIQAGAGTATATLEGSFGRIRGGTGNLTVDDLTASNTIIGSTSNTTSVTVHTAATNSDVFGRTGAMSILDLGANALMGAGDNSGSVTIGGANAQLYGSESGNGTLYASIGAANALVMGLNNNTTVDASSSAATGALVFGGFSSVAADNGTLSIQGGVDSLVAVTGGDNSTINAGAGNTFVYIGTGTLAGSNLINGGAGILDVNFIGGAGSATVFGGAGTTSLFGADGTNATFVGNGTGGFLYANGTSVGGETLNGGTSNTNDTLFGASGNVSLVAGTGSDELFAGVNTGALGGTGTVTGGDTMVGGTGADLVIFQHGVWSGAAVVTNFSTADSYVLSGYGTGAAAAALSTSTSTGGDTTVALADGTHITFTDATAAQLAGHLIST